MLSLLAIIVLSYLIGSIPGSLWAGLWLYGTDIRNYGSGNPGATNAFRVLGWKAGTVATLIDMGKGVLAAGVVGPVIYNMGGVPSFGFSSWETATMVSLIAGLSAFLGHMFPVWAKFNGGKGVNTAAGVLLAITPITTLITMAVFAAVLLSTRYVSLASITAAITFPTTVAIRRYLFDITSLDQSLLIFGTILALGIVVAHHANIKRLLQGNENRVSSFRPAQGMRGRGEL